MSYKDLILTKSPNYYFTFTGGTVTQDGSATISLSTGVNNTFSSSSPLKDGAAYIVIPNGGDTGFTFSDSLSIFNDREFSMTGWFKVDNGNITSDPNYIFKAQQLSVYLQRTDKTYLVASANGKQVNTTASPLTNSWHHFAVTMNTTNLKLYVDGVLVSTDTSPTTLDVDANQKYFLRQWSGYQAATGNFDEIAVFNSTLSQAEVVAQYDYMMGAGANAPALTANGLFANPAIIVTRNPNYTATVATASGLFPQPSFNETDFPTMLDTYLAGRSFEQWYKFDEIGKINNYGSGGDASTAWAFTNISIEPQLGIQGSGALKLKGEAGAKVQLAFGVNEPYSTEITDNEFSIGFWFKGESGYADKTPNIFFIGNPFGADSYLTRITSSGYVEFKLIRPNGTEETLQTSTNILDNNWHLIQVRASDSNNLIKLSVDNGTELSTTVNGTFPSVGNMFFGDAATGGSNNKYAYISNYWVTGYNSITSTERAAMINAAAVPIQGTAKIIPATARFTNQYQEKIDTYSPKIAFRLNEASSTPINYGTTNGTLSVAKNGTNITYLQPTQNTYAYKFTNADTYIQGDYAFTSGTFSSGNHQTMAAVFKAESTVNFEQLIGSMGMYGFLGSGITLSIGGTNGYLEARINQGFGGADTDSLTTTINVCDNKYHHVVGVRDGSSFKLYLDGKQVATKSDAVTNLSDSAAYGISAEAKFNFGQGAATKALYVDEFAVMSTALSATQVFDLFQSLNIDGAFTASGTFINPAYTAGTGRTITPTALIASGLFRDPTQQDTIAPTIAPMTANALFGTTNFAAEKNFDHSASPMLASAEEEPPFTSGNGIINAEHFTASALFPNAYSRIPGVWNASPMIATANAVQPGLATTLGALVKPQSLNATAQFPLPPAYYLVSDDKWYQRLLNVDYQSANYGGKITFFNTSTNIYLNGSYDGWTAQSNRNAFNSYYGYNMNDTPLPVATAGGFDPVFRKTLNLRNIALSYADATTYTQDWTFETMIKTTKSNQILLGGYLLGDTSSSTSRSYRTGFRLNDGKFALIPSKDTTYGFLNSTDEVAFTGFKNVADGEWHHVIIQYRASGIDSTQPRLQIFIDGKLDIQRYGYRAYVPNQIGFNSSDANAYSDFELSAVAVNKASFVLEREININYLAAFGITPIEVGPMLASAELTQKNRARGNRGRALMLYFWDTFSPTRNDYQATYSGGPGGNLLVSTTSNDQGAPGDDPDSFYQLNTWINNAPSKFYDWDIWPCPVVRFPSGESYNGDTHPILKDGITKSGTKNGTVYVDPVTDDYRYLDLMNDLKDLDQFDMICFRNYPDNSSERDGYGTTAKGIADPYFNTLDKDLFQNFLNSLREAVDTGVSLFITNPQLAIDLGFIDGYESIPDLAKDVTSDTYAPIHVTDPLNTGIFSPSNLTTDLNDAGRDSRFYDLHKNNKHRVVNTIPGLTDDKTWIWTDIENYEPDGLQYGELGRVWQHYEYKENGLQIGDEFLISDIRTLASNYFAVPFNKINAGKVITAFAQTYKDGLIDTINPYRNYATTIAVEPGTVVAGKQIGAKIFISLTETPGTLQVSGGFGGFGNIQSNEYLQIELKTDYWIDKAYNDGAISDSQKIAYKTDERNFDRRLEAGSINQAQYDKEVYWQLNGEHIIGQLVPYGNQETGSSDATDQNGKKKKVRSATRTFNPSNVFDTVISAGLPNFKLVWGWIYPLANLYLPTINTRGLLWLSERLAYDTLPQRPSAMIGSALMPNPTVTGYKVASVNAQAMIANGKINEVAVNNVSAKSPNITNPALPMTAQAKLVGIGLNVIAGVATASARITTGYVYTTDLDQVTLYIMHEDPILYIREDVIK